MKKISLTVLFGLFVASLFAAFPIETQSILADADPEKFQFNILAFLLGVITIWLMPYSLLFLLVKSNNFKKSIAIGWLVGLLLILLLVVALISGFDGLTIY